MFLAKKSLLGQSDRLLGRFVDTVGSLELDSRLLASLLRCFVLFVGIVVRPRFVDATSQLLGQCLELLRRSAEQSSESGVGLLQNANLVMSLLLNYKHSSKLDELKGYSEPAAQIGE